jgi:futalosine hydrolase
MILALAATEFEMTPLTRLLATAGVGASMCRTLVSGVGMVETALRLARYLEHCDSQIDWILHFGVAGAYVTDAPDPDGHANLLDLCLAEEENLGDFGICYADRIESFEARLGGPVRFSLDQSLVSQASAILTRHGLAHRQGNFVTVSAVSATKKRGMMLAGRFNGLCENMEGAAVARVCSDFSLPVLELRAVSNLVEDRDVNRWQMAAACNLAAEAAVLLICELGKS